MRLGLDVSCEKGEPFGQTMRCGNFVAGLDGVQHDELSDSILPCIVARATGGVPRVYTLNCCQHSIILETVWILKVHIVCRVEHIIQYVTWFKVLFCKQAKYLELW